MPDHPPPDRRPGRRRPPPAGRWLRARAAAYRWPCACGCTTNLRGLLREVCAHCGHQHQPPAKETP